MHSAHLVALCPILLSKYDKINVESHVLRSARFTFKTNF